MNRLDKITIKGFKSIDNLGVDGIKFGPINIMIGPNGAGKSNLIGFFRLLNAMLSGPSGGLQRFVAENGGASKFLHHGPKRTREIEAHITLSTEKGRNEYAFRLVYAASDTLIFTEEKCRFLPNDTVDGNWTSLDVGHKEAKILDQNNLAARTTRNTITTLLRGLVVYHFQDTSAEARIKSKSNINDYVRLKFDASNIAPFLFYMKEYNQKYYQRIVETIRQVAPFFDDFVLEVEHGSMLLRWSERGSDLNFDASQMSDGTLRAIALITALLQPVDKLPHLIILDEPELGLHPYAINLVSGLIKSVALERQVLIATQSPAILDAFDADQILVVERNDKGGSQFKTLDPGKLEDWLDDYSLSELWDRNIIGGRPKEVHS